MRLLPLYSAMLPCDRCGSRDTSVREDGTMRFRRQLLDLGWICDDCAAGVAVWFNVGRRDAEGQLTLEVSA